MIVVELCAACGAAATRWCDAIIGFGPKFEDTAGPLLAGEPRERRMVIDMERPYVCDAPLCVGCGSQVGHVCGHLDPGLREQPWSDTVDWCPAHPRGGSVQILRPAELVAERERVAAQLARRAEVLPFPEVVS